MAGARPIVAGPAFATLPYGLWDAAQQPAADAHWRQGVTWIERCPTGGTTYEECVTVTGTGAPPAPASKSSNVSQTFRGATPFTIFTEFDCAPVGQDVRATTNAAVEALARVENHQVEAAFWTGTAGGQAVAFPHLAASAQVLDAQSMTLQPAASQVVTGTGTDVADGLGRLEAQLASCYKGQGVIHVPVTALPTLQAWGLVSDRGGSLYTARGNRVVVGGGYANTSPSGVAAAAGTAWLYATGAVFGWRSDVRTFQLGESFDRAENTVKWMAERTYVIGFECCLLAAQVDTGVPVT